MLRVTSIVKNKWLTITILVLLLAALAFTLLYLRSQQVKGLLGNPHPIPEYVTYMVPEPGSKYSSLPDIRDKNNGHLVCVTVDFSEVSQFGEVAFEKVIKTRLTINGVRAGPTSSTRAVIGNLAPVERTCWDRSIQAGRHIFTLTIQIPSTGEVEEYTWAFTYAPINR